jgi:hypothetical protein
MGRSVIRKICSIVELMGSAIAADRPIKCWSARFANVGIVNTVMILLNAVRVTESATSPFAKYVIKFDDGPPGHNASIINPTAIVGGIGTTLAITKPIIGRIIN